jgi:phosphomannomutase
MRSVSGIRGVVGPDFNPAVIAGYVNAFVRLLGAKKVVVGRDTRPTGSMVEGCVAAALQASGADVVLLGIASTPTVEMAVVQQCADAGIIITASHNPIEWNALKFLDREGIFLDESRVQKLFALVDNHRFDWESHSGVGAISRFDDAGEDHLRAILALSCIDVELIRQRRFKAAYDGVNGAGSGIVPQLLGELGCDIQAIHVAPNGLFPHNPEPTPENLADLRRVVREKKCDLGFATDPDADRCALVDERGEAIGEEYTLALAVEFMLRRRKGPVTINLSTSRMIEDIAARHGVEAFRAKVGEVNVTMAMRENGSVIGGEGNGGVILPDLHYGRDGILAVALTLQYLAERGGGLSSLVGEIPAYCIDKRKIDLAGKSLPEAYAKLEKAFSGASVDRRDGLRFAWERSWVHFRPSNTEPVARVIAEAPTREETTRLCLAVEKELGKG